MFSKPWIMTLWFEYALATYGKKSLCWLLRKNPWFHVDIVITYLI